MDDQPNPRPDHVRETESIDRWRKAQERSSGSIGAVAAIVAALFAGLLLLSMWGTPDRADTQVGQNVERTTTPDTPRNPNAPK